MTFLLLFLKIQFTRSGPHEINGLQPVWNPNTGLYIAIIEVQTDGCPVGVPGSPPYILMLAESADGALTFHLKSNVPLDGMYPHGAGNPLYAGGRATYYVNGHWASFPHINYPTYIAYTTSPDLFNWYCDPSQISNASPIRKVIIPIGNDWGMSTLDQAADSSILKFNGNTYLFYDKDDNAHYSDKIGYAIYHGTLAQYDNCALPSPSRQFRLPTRRQ